MISSYNYHKFNVVTSQAVLMEPYDLLEVDHRPVKEEWRSVTTTSGALSVMTRGTVWMQTLLVCILVTVLKVDSFIAIMSIVVTITSIIFCRCNCSKNLCIRTRNWTYFAGSSSLYWK